MGSDPAPAARRPSRLAGAVVGAAAVVWLGGAAAGFAVWGGYDATPGPQAVGAAGPGDAAGSPWALTVYAHPHCPCTRAGLAELAELARARPVGLDIRVVFVRPAGAEAGWERTASWDAAAAIPGVRVCCDPDGAEAGRAGAITSGHAVLADRAGRVAFRGGLARGRGRAGESAGRRAVLAIAAGEGAAAEAPVYGCPLVDDPR
ncbi:MAG TPA: hypothetical protein VH092_31800 [Urbifossiella sp.]|jgi:hypothetical protein|nr:hypothetical protein [Urbifossiella sp.]